VLRSSDPRLWERKIIYQDGPFPFVDVAKPGHRLTFTVYLLLPFFPVHFFSSRYLEAGERPANASSRRCWNVKDGELMYVTWRTSDLLSTYYRFSFQTFSRPACCRIKNLFYLSSYKILSVQLGFHGTIRMDPQHVCWPSSGYEIAVR